MTTDKTNKKPCELGAVYDPQCKMCIEANKEDWEKEVKKAFQIGDNMMDIFIYRLSSILSTKEAEIRKEERERILEYVIDKGYVPYLGNNVQWIGKPVKVLAQQDLIEFLNNVK